MDEHKLKSLAAEWAKGLKTEADLNVFSRMLTKLTVETALNTELTEHLGHEKVRRDESIALLKLMTLSEKDIELGRTLHVSSSRMHFNGRV